MKRIKRLTALAAALACLCVGLGVWGISAEVRVSKLNKRVQALEAANTPVEPAAPAITVENPDAIAAEFNGGVVTAQEAAEEYALLASYYEMIGVPESEYAEDAKYTVLDGLVERKILEMKAQEAGVYELSPEQEAAIEERVRTEYDDTVSYYMTFRMDGSKSEQEVRDETIAYLNENGYSYDTMLAQARTDAWQQGLFEYVTADLQVSDEQLFAFYEEQAASAELTYSADFSAYEMDSDGGKIMLWNPEGVRRVQYIMVPFNEEQSIEYLSLQDARMTGDPAKLEALDAVYASLEPTAQAVLDRVNAGESFDALVQEIGGSIGNGACVSAQSTLYGDAFRDAAMALAKPGDVSGLVRVEGGYCILRYVEDVPAGRVPFEDVKDELLVNYEAELKFSYYNATVMQWIADADVHYYPEVF